MKSQQFSPAESLDLIRNMIEKTKQNISVRSHYFLLWGWAAFLAFVAQFVLKHYYNYAQHYQVWWITILCLVIMIFWLRKDKKNEQIRTYAGDSMSYLWSGLGIAFFVITLIFFRIGYQNCYPFFIVLYGLGTFISGRILNFKPLIIGGIINFLLAVACTWMEYDYQMLFGALAILTSYIIPGHLLRTKYKS